MYAEANFGFASFSPGFSPVLLPAHYAGGGELLAAFATDVVDVSAPMGNMVQGPIVSEYDLGAEGDLFKAPESFIEEPMLGLDPIAAAAISIISDGNNLMTETVKVADIESIQNDSLLSDVLNECKNDILGKSTIEDSIYELLDLKFPTGQVEEVPGQLNIPTTQVEVTSLQNIPEQIGLHIQLAAGSKGDEVLAVDKQMLVFEGPLQKSISSGCLSSMDWIPACSVRPNFLNFQQLDFEAAFGMRRAYSEGDIQNLGNNPLHGSSISVQTSFEGLMPISDLKSEERKQKLSRYRKKKVKRNFGRKIKYACRKALADSQPRVRGRFAKIEESEMLKPRK